MIRSETTQLRDEPADNIDGIYTGYGDDQITIIETQITLSELKSVLTLVIRSKSLNKKTSR